MCAGSATLIWEYNYGKSYEIIKDCFWICTALKKHWLYYSNNQPFPYEFLESFLESNTCYHIVQKAPENQSKMLAPCWKWFTINSYVCKAVLKGFWILTTDSVEKLHFMSESLRKWCKNHNFDLLTYFCHTFTLYILISIEKEHRVVQWMSLWQCRSLSDFGLKARRRRSRSLALLSVFLTQNPKGTCIDIASSSTWQILLDSISAMSAIKTTDLLDRKF